MEIEAAALPGTGLLPALVAASCWLVLIRVMSETVDYTENSLGEVLLLSSVHLQATPNVSTRRSNRPSPHVAQEGSWLLQLCRTRLRVGVFQGKVKLFLWESQFALSTC